MYVLSVNTYKKQHNVWHRELKAFFHILQGDAPYCEVCNTATPPLDIAHSLKRRHIQTREQYFEAVMLCRAHHNEYEFQGEEKMNAIIRDIIKKR